MNENGSFKKKAGFTITGNVVIRDMQLSFKAKGLYALISSYITMDNFQLSKTFLQKNAMRVQRLLTRHGTNLRKLAISKSI